MKSLNAPVFQQETIARSAQQSSAIIPVTALQTSATTLFTANGEADFWIVHLFAANVTGGSLTYTVHIVPDGGSAVVGNAVVFQQTLAANTSEPVSVALNARVEPGGTLQALCSSNDGVNMGGWGYQQFGELT